MKKLKIDFFRQEACAGAPAPPRWNARSARVVGCGFRTVMGQDRPDPIFYWYQTLPSPAFGPIESYESRMQDLKLKTAK
ncbi:MAG: hypothetical protein L0387_44305 [Acidobacteria bacterium]|nr:hypothetical protein [Acidobacteriota bacterium]MCI0628604.1 hypothetical protein [Acidobacteriota bacterium]MCI0721359.1 hypothetical protein [Acidobacteriota bacterium]